MADHRRTVADELRELLDQDDGRLIAQLKEADEWQEGTVTRVNRGDGGHDVGWTEQRARLTDGNISLSSPGLTFAAWVPGDDIPIAQGSTIRFYGRGFGFLFHGIDVDGREVFWRTPLERVAKQVADLAANDRRSRERVTERMDELLAERDRLPDAFRARLDRLAADRADFWISGEEYELFCCVEAAKVADHLQPEVEAGASAQDAVRRFLDRPYKQQKQLAGVDDGHTNGTFGGARALARAYLDGELA